jgi:hypothetical protein
MNSATSVSYSTWTYCSFCEAIFNTIDKFVWKIAMRSVENDLGVMLDIYSLVKRTFENQLPWREEVNRNRRTKSNYGLTTDSFIQAHERGKIERQAAGFNKNERKTRDLAFLQNSFVYIFYLHVFTVVFNAFSCFSKQHFKYKLSE